MSKYQKAFQIFKPAPQEIVDLSLYTSWNPEGKPGEGKPGEGKPNEGKLEKELEKPSVMEDYPEGLLITWTKKKYSDTKDPSVWGPPKWFSLHNAAAYYPINASPIVKESMKNVILALPYTLPCPTCFNHATAYIDSRRSELDDICSARDKLFKFWVDFHNMVNKRYNKAEMSLDHAWKMYTGKVESEHMTY